MNSGCECPLPCEGLFQAIFFFSFGYAVLLPVRMLPLTALGCSKRMPQPTLAGQ